MLWSEGRGPILVAAAAGWFLSIGVRMIYPVVLPQLRAAYDLDLATAGVLLTVLFLAYGLGQLPGGLLADRFGERVVLAGSTAVSAVTLGLVVTAGSTAVLFVATALFGAGIALYAVARYTLLAELYPERVGAANGVTSAAADAGQSVLPPIGGLIAAALAWQFGFAFAIPLFAVVAVALWLVVPAGGRDAAGDEGALSLGAAREVFAGLRRPSVGYGTVTLLLGVCLWQAFTGFYPTYLIEQKGLSATRAGILFGLFFALGVAVQPLSGAAYDRIGIRRSLAVVMGISAVGVAALPFVDGLGPLVVVTVLSSALLGFATITQSYLIVALPAEIQGSGFGVIRTVSFTVGAASPAAFGAAADLGFFDEAFLALAALALVVIAMTSRLPEG